MRCPFCGHNNTFVKDSRATEDNATIRRRRHCPDCEARFTTVEHVQLLFLKVRKKNGMIEPFKREKLIGSLKRALHKRNIDEAKLDKITNSIVRRLETSGDSIIDAGLLGEIVMETLFDVDLIAYIRFASVYRDFRDVKEFQNFISPYTKEEKISEI